MVAISGGLVGFYGISTIVGYLMPNPLYTYILNIYDLVLLGFMAYQAHQPPTSVITVLSPWLAADEYRVSHVFSHVVWWKFKKRIYRIWFGWVLWHINHCTLFNAKSSLYIYIKYIWFGFVWFFMAYQPL